MNFGAIRTPLQVKLQRQDLAENLDGEVGASEPMRLVVDRRIAVQESSEVGRRKFFVQAIN